MINPERLKILLLNQCYTNNQIEHFRNAFDVLSLADDKKKLMWPKLAIWLLNDPVHGFSVIADELLSPRIEEVVSAYQRYISLGSANEQILWMCAEKLIRINYIDENEEKNVVQEGILNIINVALNFNDEGAASYYIAYSFDCAIKAEPDIKTRKRGFNGTLLCQKYLDLLNEFAEEKQDLLR